ncbi:patatin-like phospholipase family protein [Dapis sp. BLCC M126]|uniref:patatin-like phospholipase family protein n=1 Tax=Dapis sp. BLCC M126 TaxID=3400189 RepID=UPI003CEA21E8
MTAENENSKTKCRILSLDGGGIRGVLSARLLKEVEDNLAKEGHKLHTYFDFVAGTSTGSILAAGIACQKSADDMIKLYKEKGKDIFLDSVSKQRKKWRPISTLVGDNILGLRTISSKFFGDVLYPHKKGDQGLAKVLQEKLVLEGQSTPANLKDIKELRILIPAYDVDSRNTTWFCNPPDDEKHWYDDIELWEICTASASAPTFFPPYNLLDKMKSRPHIDGGVSANNPSLIAIARAFELDRELNWSNIAVLSIGTGQTTKSYSYEEIKRWGAASWAKNIPNIFMDPSAISSETICRRMMTMQGGDYRNYLRLSFDLQDYYEEWKKNNKHIKKSEEKKKFEEFQEIDNPDNFDELIKAAQWYLDKGYVDKYKDTWPDGEQKVIEAIEDFIKTNPKPINDSNSDPDSESD